MHLLSLAYAMLCVGEGYVSYPEHVYTWEGYSNRSVSYPSPTHSVCEDIVVTLLVRVSVCLCVCVSPVNS